MNEDLKYHKNDKNQSPIKKVNAIMYRQTERIKV